jgi:hypothetical protein
MRLLEFLAQVFITTFGITQPSPEQQRRVSLILGGTLLAVLLGAISVVGFFLYQIRAGR